MTDVVSDSLNLGEGGRHEHAWRCLEDGDSGAWAFECTMCHRTRAGLRIGRHGKVESPSDVENQGQQASVDERERALDVRESTLRAQESRQMERRDAVENLLVRAAQRDVVTDARDAAATERDRAANLHASRYHVEDRLSADARQEALDDRMHSHCDRKASAVDRAILADEEPQALEKRSPLGEGTPLSNDPNGAGTSDGDAEEIDTFDKQHYRGKARRAPAWPRQVERRMQ